MGASVIEALSFATRVWSLFKEKEVSARNEAQSGWIFGSMSMSEP